MLYIIHLDMPITKRRVKLNVSGEIFETYEETLSRFPVTLLGEKNWRDLHFCPITGQYFFDRNRVCFEAILYFYQSNGVLNCPKDVRIPIFEQECRFFMIPDDFINCMKRREGIIFDLEDDDMMDLNQSFQTQVWNLLEKPNTSYAAWAFGLFSISMIWFSIITAFLETTSFLKKQNIFPKIELGLNTWFLTEFVVRFLCTQNKSKFMKKTMNLVDLLAVIPYFIVVMLGNASLGFLGIFKTLKFLRVFRLFRLSKHSRRLKVVGIILKSSLGNFRLLMLCLVLVIFLGGTFIYFTEQYTPQSEFNSIPQGIWWSVQTFTSVGYGDLIPMTIIGRTFACCFMLFGILTISLPVLTIVSQFTTLYPKNVESENYETKNKTEERWEDSQKTCKSKLKVVNKLAARKVSVLL